MTMIILLLISLLFGTLIGATLATRMKRVNLNIFSLVTSAEFAYDKQEWKMKCDYVRGKIKAIHPFLVKVLGDTYVDILIDRAVKGLQMFIGTTSERIEKQKEALNSINDSIITKTKELTAKVLSQNLIDREFFGDFTKVSNEQIHEEMNKILESTKIDDMIVSNLQKIKTNLLQIKNKIKY